MARSAQPPRRQIADGALTNNAAAVITGQANEGIDDIMPLIYRYRRPIIAATVLELMQSGGTYALSMDYWIGNSAVRLCGCARDGGRPHTAADCRTQRNRSGGGDGRSDGRGGDRRARCHNHARADAYRGDRHGESERRADHISRGVRRNGGGPHLSGGGAV